MGRWDTDHQFLLPNCFRWFDIYVKLCVFKCQLTRLASSSLQMYVADDITSQNTQLQFLQPSLTFFLHLLHLIGYWVLWILFHKKISDKPSPLFRPMLSFVFLWVSLSLVPLVSYSFDYFPEGYAFLLLFALQFIFSKAWDNAVELLTDHRSGVFRKEHYFTRGV